MSAGALGACELDSATTLPGRSWSTFAVTFELRTGAETGATLSGMLSNPSTPLTITAAYKGDVSMVSLALPSHLVAPHHVRTALSPALPCARSHTAASATTTAPRRRVVAFRRPDQSAAPTNPRREQVSIAVAPLGTKSNDFRFSDVVGVNDIGVNALSNARAAAAAA